jgi:tetratricopeptide (TPR) repeat protein
MASTRNRRDPPAPGLRRTGRGARHRPTPDDGPRLDTPGAAPPRGSARAAALILLAFALTFGGLAAHAFTRTSATWDEPMHLTAGYAAVARGDFSVDPSHPPLLRAWASLPALFMSGVSMPSVPADRTDQLQWLEDAYLFAHRFMYVENDADRLLYSARFMTATLGILLGVLVFLWAREWLGLVPAASALALYALEPNLMAHSSLVTTDLGVTCFVFASVYFTWRTCRRFTWPNAAGLIACFALAIVSKFSAVLLAPVVAVLLAAAIRSGSMPLRRALVLVFLIAVASIGAIWASYGFRYLPAPAGLPFTLHETFLAERSPALSAVVAWVDARRLLPNAFTQGLLYTQASTAGMPAFFAGAYSDDGWWYYFPAAVVLKTPIALLLLVAAGAAVLAASRKHADWLAGRPWLFVLLPIGVFLGVAMQSGVNIGLRHVLPIYPFLILVAATAVHAAMRMPPRRAAAALAAVAVAASAELATAYPYPLTFFNQLAGGPENGHRYLADSNLGWGQNLKPLKAWMDRNGVAHVNLAYFGQADPEYYGISCTHLPGAPKFAQDATARPTLPGYVAISATRLTGVYSPASWRLFYQPFLNLKPVAVLGHALRIYWVEEWPAPAGTDAAGVAPEAHRSLGEALLHGLQWPERAVLHYAKYLEQEPDDVDATVDYAVSLVGANRIDAGIAMLRRAVELAPAHGRAQLTLAKALFGSRDLDGALRHGQRAAAAAPGDPEVHHLLGRMHAVQGRFEQAAEDFRRVLEIAPAHRDARQYLDRIVAATQDRGRSARR